MSKDKLPESIQQFWKETPTEYTKEIMYHLEPESENTVFLKYLILNAKSPPTETFYLKSLEGDFLFSKDNFKLVFLSE